MDEYRCYSDASYKAGQPAGFGVMVVVRDADGWNVHKKFSGRFEASSATDAELRAMVVALKFVPSGSQGTSYSDLNSIGILVSFRCSYAKKHVEIILRLNNELERTGLSVEFAERQHRSHWYTECHRMARKALGRPARPTAKRKVKVKKWWTIRPG